MSPERELAQLVAHPWTEYRHGNETYYGATCQVVYAAKVNQLAAICELHRRTPITKEIMELNGFIDESDPKCGSYNYALREYSGNYPLEDVEIEKNTGIVRFFVLEGCEEVYAEVCRLHSVTDLENILDLLGIDKQIKLPKPKKQTNATQE